MRSKLVISVGLATAIATAMGCASTSNNSYQSDEEIKQLVEQRAKEQWGENAATVSAPDSKTPILYFTSQNARSIPDTHYRTATTRIFFNLAKSLTSEKLEDSQTAASNELAKRVFLNLIEGFEGGNFVLTSTELADLEGKYLVDLNAFLTTAKHFDTDKFITELSDLRAKRLQRNLALMESKLVVDDQPCHKKQAARPSTQQKLDHYWQACLANEAKVLSQYGFNERDIPSLLANRHSYRLSSTYDDPAEANFSQLMNAIFGSLDPHAAYFSPRSKEEFQQAIELRYSGIGAQLSSKDYQLEVSNVFQAKDSQPNPLRNGDRIVGLAQGNEPFKDIGYLSIEDAVSLLRGEKGTKVTLRVARTIEAEEKVLDLELTRNEFEQEEQRVSVEWVDNTATATPIALVRMKSFYSGASADLKRALNEISNVENAAVIIDLRGNGGGALSEAFYAAGLFLGKQPVLQSVFGGKTQIHKTETENASYHGSVALLVDHQTAGACEIFAAALQDYNRGLIIGEPTFGFGTVQQYRNIGRRYDVSDRDFGSIQLSIGRTYRITGKGLQNAGVSPDLTLTMSHSEKPHREKNLDYAFSYKEIAAISYSPTAASLADFLENYKADAPAGELDKDATLSHAVSATAKYAAWQSNK